MSEKRKDKTSWNKGEKFSEEHKENLSKANLNREVLTCPHCGKASTHNMKRFHFDNCKVVNENIEYHNSNLSLGRVKVTDIDGNVNTYKSSAEVSRQLKIDLHSVLRHAKNKTSFTRGKCKGWKFELKEFRKYDKN